MGLELSVGISTGAGAINVAHELMLRHGDFEKTLAEMLLASACSTHLCIEHVRGDHKRVATPVGPASARLGEAVVAFLRGLYLQPRQRLAARGPAGRECGDAAVSVSATGGL